MYVVRCSFGLRLDRRDEELSKSMLNVVQRNKKRPALRRAFSFVIFVRLRSGSEVSGDRTDQVERAGGRVVGNLGVHYQIVEVELDGDLSVAESCYGRSSGGCLAERDPALLGVDSDHFRKGCDRPGIGVVHGDRVGLIDYQVGSARINDGHSQKVELSGRSDSDSFAQGDGQALLAVLALTESAGNDGLVVHRGVVTVVVVAELELQVVHSAP